jgi:hypothetical protein
MRRRRPQYRVLRQNASSRLRRASTAKRGRSREADFLGFCRRHFDRARPLANREYYIVSDRLYLSVKTKPAGADRFASGHGDDVIAE